jgi:tripartite-type tricarboxylate transporter receptor subunit TctC
LVMAGMSQGGNSSVGACLVAEVLGIKGAVLLYGHASSPDAGLAMATGELEAYALTGSSVKDHLGKGWVKKPLVILDTSRIKIFPDVPAITEVAQLTPSHKRLITYYTTVLKTGKAFFTTPGVPADRVEFLRDIFDKIVADKAFISQASLRWTAWEKPTPGKELELSVSQAMSVAPEDVKLVNQLVEEYKKK